MSTASNPIDAAEPAPRSLTRFEPHLTQLQGTGLACTSRETSAGHDAPVYRLHFEGGRTIEIDGPLDLSNIDGQRFPVVEAARIRDLLERHKVEHAWIGDDETLTLLFGAQWRLCTPAVEEPRDRPHWSLKELPGDRWRLCGGRRSPGPGRAGKAAADPASLASDNGAPDGSDDRGTARVSRRAKWRAAAAAALACAAILAWALITR